jgi:hypothetical protein
VTGERGSADGGSRGLQAPELCGGNQAGFTGCGKTQFKGKKCQGTTLVVPQAAQNKGRALAPEGRFSRPSPFIHSLSAACLAPGLKASDLAAEFRGAEAPRSLRRSACKAPLNQEACCSKACFAENYPPLAHTTNRAKPRCLSKAGPSVPSETSLQPSRPNSAAPGKKSALYACNATQPILFQQLAG